MVDNEEGNDVSFNFTEKRRIDKRYKVYQVGEFELLDNNDTSLVKGRLENICIDLLKNNLQ